MGFSDMYTLNSITESHLFMNSDSPIRSPTSKLCMNLGVFFYHENHMENHPMLSKHIALAASESLALLKSNLHISCTYLFFKKKKKTCMYVHQLCDWCPWK